MYWPAQAAVTQYHGLGGLNNSLFPHDFGGWRPKIRVLVGFVSSEASLPSFQMTVFLLRPRLTFSVYVRTPGVCSSYRDSIPIGLGSSPYDLI